jgi:hypothetical protein
MNEKKAKALRKRVYGDQDFRQRHYYKGKVVQIKNVEGLLVAEHITVLADPMRQLYQNLKRS